jgi:hypothetical protein
MKKQSGFIRGIWGGRLDKQTHWFNRKTKVDKDVQLSLLNPYEPKYHLYIFGDDNFKQMCDLGYDCTLIDKKPIVWDMEKEQYRHKIEIWKCGLMDFEEVVFADFDCVPLKKLPDDFWRVLGSGEKIQASLFQYRKSRLFFRPNDTRKVSAATFVYMRGSDVADGIIKTWEKMGRPCKEEYALSKYIDDLDGGWKGLENYKKYEPRYHNTFWYYDKEYYLKFKDPIYCHFNTHRISYFIGDKKNIKDRLGKEYQMEVERQRKCYKV